MPQFDVTIAGELNLDLILYGLPQELPPERELLAERMIADTGKFVGNRRAQFGRARRKSRLISRIGDDSLGQIAVEGLAAGNVDVSKFAALEGATKTGLTVILQREKLRNILTYPGTIFDLTLEDLDF